METTSDLRLCPNCAADCLSSDWCAACGWRIDSTLVADAAFAAGLQPCAAFDWAVDAVTGTRVPGLICRCGAEKAPCDACGRWHHAGGWRRTAMLAAA